MSTLIEDLYTESNFDVNSFVNIKIKDLSHFDKLILGIDNFHGYQDNTIMDVLFVNRIPLQMTCYKYKFLERYLNSLEIEP